MSAISVRRQFRERLQAKLHTEFKIPFEPGEIAAPQADVDVGCVWWEGKRPWSRDANEEESYFRVRVIRQFMQDQGAVEPRTKINERLEADAEKLEDVLVANLTTLGATLVVVNEVTSDQQGQFVEAQIVAYMRNRTAAGG